MDQATVRIGYNDTDLQNGLRRTGASVRRFSSETRSSFTGLAADMRGALSAGLAAVGTGAIIGKFKALNEELDRTGDLAHQLGVSAESIQRLGYMAKLSGTDVESAAKALNRVNKELAGGKGVDAFKALNIDLKEFFAADADQQMIMLAKAFQEAQRSGKGLAEAYDLFGKSAAELLPLLQSTAKELDEASKHHVVSNEDIERIQKFNDLLDTTKMQAKAWTATIFMGELDTISKLTAATESYFNKVMAGKEEALAAMEAFGEQIRGASEGAGSIAGSVVDVAGNKAKAAAEASEKEAATKREKEGTEKVLDIQERITDSLKANKMWHDAIEQVQNKELREAQDMAKWYDEMVDAQMDLEKEQAKEKKEKDKERDSRLESIRDLEKEMEILELRYKGHKKQADAVEKEARIKKEAHDLAVKTGISEKQALETIKHKFDLEEKIAKRGEGRDHRTHGYTNEQRARNSYLHGSDLDEFYRNNERFEANRRNIIYPTRTRVMDDKKTSKAAEQSIQTMKSLEQYARETANNTSELKGK